MRRVRKIIGVDKKTPVIEQRPNSSNIIRKGTRKNITKKVYATKNVPKVNRVNHRIDKSGKYNSYKDVSTVNPIWEGETVYIIGGGTSLKTFNWNGLRGKRVIAINKAFYTYPEADVMYWTDSRIWNWYKSDIKKFNGLKYTIRPRHDYEGPIKVLRKGKTIGLEEAKDRLAHGNNSGYAAINLAYHLGAKTIVLLGYDMKNDGTKGHYHDGYPVPITADKIYKSQFMPGFETLAAILRDKKIKVFNASPVSALKCFPIISQEKALSLS